MEKQIFITQSYKAEKFNFSKLKVDPIKNHLNRPEGGLWTSTFNPEYGSDWLRSSFIQSDYEKKGFLFSVKNSVRMLNIDNIKKAIDILEKYKTKTLIEPIRIPNGIEVGMGVYIIDFEKIAKTYDCLRVTKEVASISTQYNGRYSPFGDWNVESSIWFNLDHLELIKEYTNEELLNFTL